MSISNECEEKENCESPYSEEHTYQTVLVCSPVEEEGSEMRSAAHFYLEMWTVRETLSAVSISHQSQSIIHNQTATRADVLLCSRLPVASVLWLEVEGKKDEHLTLSSGSETMT